MGIRKLPGIVKELLDAGLPESTAIAIIENGTRKEQKIITGTLYDILTYNDKIKSPALIVIGEVVKLREEILNKVIVNNIHGEVLNPYEVFNEVLPYLSWL
jgi:siroheme synthase